MKENRIQKYLQAMERQLWLRGLSSSETLIEIESHLLDSVESHERRGLSRDDAEQQALERFGSVNLVAKTFENERVNLMQNILLAISIGSGLFFAYIDSRPTWDDTGILAGAVLLTCGLISLIGYRRPWLLALAVGSWIPLRGLIITHNYFSILALIIAFIGAYAGWAFRLGIIKTFKTT